MSRPKSKIKTGTQVSISLPEGLIARIDELAAADNRTRSNFIANTMQNAVKAADAAKEEAADGQ